MRAVVRVKGHLNSARILIEAAGVGLCAADDELLVDLAVDGAAVPSEALSRDGRSHLTILPEITRDCRRLPETAALTSSSGRRAPSPSRSFGLES